MNNDTIKEKISNIIFALIIITISINSCFRVGNGPDKPSEGIIYSKIMDMIKK